MQGTGDKGFVTGDGTVTELDRGERGDAVELTGHGLDGKPIDLSSMRGTPVVVVVWGSWCTECIADAPAVAEAARQLGGEAHVVGIDIRDPSVDQALSFERHFEVPYPSVYSPDGQAMLAFSGALTPNSIPSFVVLDGEGRVAASIIGSLPSTQTLVDLVADVSGSSGSSTGGTNG